MSCFALYGVLKVVIAVEEAALFHRGGDLEQSFIMSV